MKLNLTYVGEKKDVQTKFGLKKKFSIKAKEYADNFLAVWVSSQTANWKVGDSVEVENVESREYNGKTYYDVKMPKMEQGGQLAKTVGELATRIGLLQVEIGRIIDHLSNRRRLDLTSAGTKVPDFVPNTPQQAKEHADSMSSYEAKVSKGEDDINPDEIPW